MAIKLSFLIILDFKSIKREENGSIFIKQQWIHHSQFSIKIIYLKHYLHVYY